MMPKTILDYINYIKPMRIDLSNCKNSGRLVVSGCFYVTLYCRDRFVAIYESLSGSRNPKIAAEARTFEELIKHLEKHGCIKHHPTILEYVVNS